VIVARYWVFVALLTGCAVAGQTVALPSAHGGGGAVLRICTTGDYLPLTYRDPDTGAYRGIDIEMANDLAGDLGRVPEFVATSWPTLARDLTDPGKCDIAMGGISATPARRQIAEFTAPYLSNGKVALVRAVDADRFQTIDQIDQSGVRVIENSGGTNEQFARQRLVNVELIIWPDNTTIFDQLVDGHADVMITDAIEADYQATQHPELVAVHPDQPYTSDRKVYLLPLRSALAGQVNRWLNRVLSDGTFNRLYSEWMD
jgi:cyclohexadienyl dehydratase